MVTRGKLAEVALDFLTDVAKAAENELGKHPERLQRSEWIVHTGPGRMSSQTFERKVFDHGGISLRLQIRDASPPQQQLADAVIAAGIEPSEVQYGFVLPLVYHWLELWEPFAFFEEEAISKILDAFCDAQMIPTSQNKLTYLQITCNLLPLPPLCLGIMALFASSS